MIPTRLIIILLLTRVALEFPSAAAESFTPPSAIVPITYFGVHNFRFHDPKLRPTVKFGTWRLWDTGTGWAQLEPRKGEWNFNRLDFAVTVASSAGMDVILTMGRTPQWASMRPAEPSFYGLGEAAPPAIIANYENYVGIVAERYKGRIKKFEVWNEPASSKMYSGTVAEMVRLVSAAKRAIKRVDSENELVCPSPAKDESLKWFDAFLAAGGAKECDIIGYHFYTDSPLPEARILLIEKVKKIVALHGLSGKPIWDTESGFRTDISQSNTSTSNSSHIARWLILSWVGGLERFIWYSWDHDRLGFVDSLGVVREPELKAYQTVMRWMLGSQFYRCDKDSQVWKCDLRLANGKNATVLWTEDNSTLLKNTEDVFWFEELSGIRGKVSNGSLRLSGEPVLIFK